MSEETSGRLRQVREVFVQVADAAEPDRAALLDRLCRDDKALRREVENLIRADREAADGGFMTEPTGAFAISTAGAPLTEGPGTKIGPYKLLQLIGEGGFGAIFMADQESPVRRRVALKIIKLGMDTRSVVARFEQEREALAMMDHPNIAKVLDAGATESGRPYFVMEYVKGDNAVAFADAHKLSVRDRLDLFTQTCAAVQHAHTKGIIHRDLKPSNVLVSMVDGRPLVKVIDFGIAKATGAAGGRLTEKTLFTEHRQLIGTPEYMSPEQAEGSPDIDTRTDVYGLGVLLYELLTGLTPFDGRRLRSAAWEEMRRIIREEEPPSPSLRLVRRLGGTDRPALSSEALRAEPSQDDRSGTGVAPGSEGHSLDIVAAARKTEPAKLGPLIRGELDWIVMKALDKDRDRRYETASALADDVRRHLTGEPVVAAPPSAAYRLRKFVRKHKTSVLTGSAVAAALLIAMAGTTLGFTKYKAEAIARAEAVREQEIQAQRINQKFEESLAYIANSGRGLDDPILRGVVPFGDEPMDHIEKRPVLMTGMPFDGSPGPQAGVMIQWNRDSDGQLKPVITGVRYENGIAVTSALSSQFNSLEFLGYMVQGALRNAVENRKELEAANASLREKLRSEAAERAQSGPLIDSHIPPSLKP